MMWVWVRYWEKPTSTKYALGSAAKPTTAQKGKPVLIDSSKVDEDYQIPYMSEDSESTEIEEEEEDSSCSKSLLSSKAERKTEEGEYEKENNEEPVLLEVERQKKRKGDNEDYVPKSPASQKSS